jgi:hypothetical protein
MRMTVHAARNRNQVEFIEMPGLKLTLAQIGRLCNLSKEICEPAVTLPVAAGFLATTRDGAYLRRGLFSDAEPPSMPPAVAICGRLA